MYRMQRSTKSAELDTPENTKLHSNHACSSLGMMMMMMPMSPTNPECVNALNARKMIVQGPVFVSYVTA
jgi:hypothetical protein